MIHIVLYNPEIPLNTGNAARTAIATDAKLHLIKPLGFSMEEKSLKRYSAGFMLDADITVYENWEDFTSRNEGTMFFLTRHGDTPPSDFNMSDSDSDIYLVFGSESSGVPKEILKQHKETLMRLPMSEKSRSVNLSNTVMTVVYEALRQQNYNSLVRSEPHKIGFLDD